MSEQKIWIGRGKKVEGYDIIGGSICIDDITPEHITTSKKNGKRYVNISILAKREPDKWGFTHGICINTYKKKEAQEALPEVNESDVPF